MVEQLLLRPPRLHYPKQLLREAAPDDFVQIGTEDAARLGVSQGDWLRVASRRGAAEARAEVGDIEPGHAFIPFHFGYWDNPGRARAANELTLFEWDAVSKQPHFKHKRLSYSYS